MDLSSPSFFALPDLVSKNQYKNPIDHNDTAFQLGHNTEDHFFDYLNKNPERLAQMANHMAGYRTGRPSWMDPNFYPVEENLVKHARTEPDAVFLVDIGGGKGHDLQELYRKHPRLPGKLILQELKGVIEEAKVSQFQSSLPYFHFNALKVVRIVPGLKLATIARGFVIPLDTKINLVFNLGIGSRRKNRTNGTRLLYQSACQRFVLKFTT